MTKKTAQTASRYSEETRQRLSESTRGKWADPRHRALRIRAMYTTFNEKRALQGKPLLILPDVPDEAPAQPEHDAAFDDQLTALRARLGAGGE